MTIIDKLNNIKPREKVIYYTGSNISQAGIIEIRNTAYHLYLQDKVILVQKLLERNGLNSSTFDYIAIGKEQPPDLKAISERENYVNYLGRKV